MISLAKVLQGNPIPVTKGILFYQPTLSEIVKMGEAEYWGLVNVWTLKRADMIQQENESTRELDDYTLWRACVFSAPIFRNALITSCATLLKSKVEFFDISGTIYIGERSSGVILDETFYLLMRELCSRIIPPSSASEEEGQYRETDNMSERERQMIEKMYRKTGGGRT